VECGQITDSYREEGTSDCGLHGSDPAPPASTCGAQRDQLNSRSPPCSAEGFSSCASPLARPRPEFFCPRVLGSSRRSFLDALQWHSHKLTYILLQLVLPATWLSDRGLHSAALQGSWAISRFQPGSRFSTASLPLLIASDRTLPVAWTRDAKFPHNPWLHASSFLESWATQRRETPKSTGRQDTLQPLGSCLLTLERPAGCACKPGWCRCGPASVGYVHTRTAGCVWG
jgi:hypothetical protein